MNIDTLLRTLSGITSLAMILATALSIYTNLRKLPTDLRSNNVDLAEKAMKLVNDEIGRRVTMTAEIDSLKLKINDNEATFTKKLEDYEMRLKICSERADKFEDYSKRLCAQLTSLRYVPVPLDPEPKG